jgi:hypothetical protein
MPRVNLITISLSPPYPTTGMTSTIVRLDGQDKANLDVAAANMGLSRAAFMRLLLVRGTERVLRELGIEIEYEQNAYVDLSKGETFIE